MSIAAFNEWLHVFRICEITALCEKDILALMLNLSFENKSQSNVELAACQFFSLQSTLLEGLSSTIF